MAKAKWHKLPAFTIPLFNSAHVYLATTMEQYQYADKFLGGSGEERPFNYGLASNYENTDTGERIYLIGVFDNQIATLVHECAHVCFYVCSDVGVTTNPEDSNETYCYMLDRMFSHFLPSIQEQQNGKAHNSKAQEDSKV